MPYLVGIDIGGTFTDAAAVSTEDGRIYAAKARSTPDDLVEGLLESLNGLAEQIGASVEDLLRETVKFAHGTTQTSNVIFTWRGARTGLITTRGFADEVLIMRARGRVAGLPLSARRHLRATDKPPEIVPRDLIEEVSERIDHRGRVILSLSEREAIRAVESLVARGVEAIAVALLWAPENPEHELLLERVIRERAPDIYVSLSHRLAPVLGEYERTATAVVNAFVGPTVEGYLARLDQRLRDMGLREPLLILQASGGVVQAEQTVPVNTIESGPAAGMIAVKALSEATGHRNIIATDVGGTTFKVGLLVDGEWSMAPETIINQYSLLIPMIDLVSIGAGGGSIAWADDGRLRVGPLSAGSDPGPAAYGWGGTKPTVTDADVVLGFLNPDCFLGGRVRLRPDLAERAVKEHVADPLFEGDVIRAAAGVRSVVDAQMADLVRKTTIERGHDPRAFVLMAYGGAGPVHAAAYARNLGVRTILIPQGATVYSAYGAAVSDIRLSLQRSVRGELLDDTGELARAYSVLEAEAQALLERQKVERSDVRLQRWADVRYERQLHDVRVTLPRDLPEEALAKAIRKEFEARYRVLYGSGAVLRGGRMRLLRIGVEAVGVIPKPPLPVLEPVWSDTEPAPIGARPIFWPEASEWVETPIYDGATMRAGHRVLGPAVIEHPGTAIVVPAGTVAQVDRFGNTVLDLAGGISA